MRTKPYCNILMFLLLFSFFVSMLYSCDKCNSNASTDATKLSKFEGKSFQLLICSANVYGFKKLHAATIPHVLDQLKKDNDDIVIFGLQESWTKSISFPGYDVYNNLIEANPVLVYQKKDFGIKQQQCALPPSNSRYANIITLSAANNLKIANTHLVGGRFDDKEWITILEGREEQLKKILEYAPDFILGDFNADIADDISTEYWQNLLTTYATLDKADELRKYKISGHHYLGKKNYKSIFDRDKISPTTPFGTVVDWIYYLKANDSTKINSIEIIESGKVETINDKLSDHNFIWGRVKIELK